MTRPAQASPECSVYADGSCLGNPGPGGWGVVLIESNGTTREFAGAHPSTTNNRMEITAALEALRITPPGAAVAIHSDSQYLVKTMTLGWKRRENLDLWRLLDAEVATRRVRWEWVRGHDGDPGNERADELARSAAEGRPPRPRASSLCHPERTRLARESKACPEPAEGDPGSPIHELNFARGEAIAQRIASMLRAGEEIRRCASCGEDFVSAGDTRHCSRISCQLHARKK